MNKDLTKSTCQIPDLFSKNQQTDLLLWTRDFSSLALEANERTPGQWEESAALKGSRCFSALCL